MRKLSGRRLDIGRRRAKLKETVMKRTVTEQSRHVKKQVKSRFPSKKYPRERKLTEAINEHVTEQRTSRADILKEVITRAAEPRTSFQRSYRRAKTESANV